MKSKNLSTFILAWSILALTLMSGCSGRGAAESEETPERGADPWVFRSVLDERPRMVTIALRDSFWIAYDTENASIYKAWRDGVELGGSVYTGRHKDLPTSKGAAFFVSRYQKPWRIIEDGTEMQPRVQYRGHRFQEGKVTLSYELYLPDGTSVTVTETPEYVEREGQPGLERVFTTADVPEGRQVTLQVHLNSLSASDSFEANGQFRPSTPVRTVQTGSAGTERTGQLVLNSNGTTRFTAWFTSDPSVPSSNEEVQVVSEHPGRALIESSDCASCHSPTVKTIGPSYDAIAARYEEGEDNVAKLAAKVIKGGGGAWTEEVGGIEMTPHPSVTPEEARQMVVYILSLDDGRQSKVKTETKTQPSLESLVDNKGPTYSIIDPSASGRQGVAVNIYRANFRRGNGPKGTTKSREDKPLYSGMASALHATTYSDFLDLVSNFEVEATGYITVPEPGRYTFRLVSAGHSVLQIGEETVVGGRSQQGTVHLKAGTHPMAVRYRRRRGKRLLSLQWKRPGDRAFGVVPPRVLTHDPEAIKETRTGAPSPREVAGTPGDGEKLTGAHPSFDLQQIRPPGFRPKVGGFDFLSDGRLVLSTWDPSGSVYLVSNIDSGHAEEVQVKRIAEGLAEPLGLKVVDDEIYVLQKQELTRLIDHDGDETIDEYRTVSNGWGVTSNFHEFAFGLLYEDGHFYATLATGILPGGASAPYQDPDRGKVIKIAKEDGAVEFLAHGLRTPNGIGYGVDDEMFVADNEGEWVPVDKIVHVQPDAFYGSRVVDFEGTAGLEVTKPALWLPRPDVSRSPSQPVPLNVGPYQNQMLFGDVTFGGIKRAFLEKVNGEYQGAVFRFSQGFEAGVNRLIWGPDRRLYVGGVGNPGVWRDEEKYWYGLQRLAYNGRSTFEMLAVRAQPDGLEIEFTESLRGEVAAKPQSYQVQQYWYKPTAEYGGPKRDIEHLPVQSVRLSEDRKRAFLKIDGMKPNHVLHLRLRRSFESQSGKDLWSTEAWYTLNQIPDR